MTQSQLTHDGFCDWKHAAERLKSHELSSGHLANTCQFKSLSDEAGRIDTEITKQLNDNMDYWRNILQRLISVIVFISERGLAFRG